jgi:FkbM family methyltransferase
MILNFDTLYIKYSLNIKGVIQVGAHHGEELEYYERLGIKNRIFFEPATTCFNILKERMADRAILIKAAVGNENKKVLLNLETANGGGSNSILTPKLHLQQYPHIQFNDKEEVDMIRLDDFNDHNLYDYNFLNIDVQGFELEVLKGASNLLNNIDYIMAEINRDEVYENCAMVTDLISFLEPYNFKLVEEDWVGGTWGDGFFVKTN